MDFHFDINYRDYKSIGEIWFKFNDKEYKYIVNVNTPDCDGCENEINAYYFVFEIKNEFGAIMRYVEYVDCFKKLASKIDKTDLLLLFNLNINKEFNKEDKNELKKLFIKIDECIIKKIKKHFNIEN